MKSLVAIMAVGRNHLNKDFGLKNLVNHTVFLRDFTRPLSRPVFFQRFRMSSTRLRVHHKFANKPLGFFERQRFKTLQLSQVFFCFWRDLYFVHQPTLFKNSDNVSPGSIFFPFPKRRLSRAWSTRAKNSSSVIKVGSFSCSLTTRRTYFATRANAASLPEMAPSPCRISALYELIAAVFILIVFIV